MQLLLTFISCKKPHESSGTNSRDLFAYLSINQIPLFHIQVPTRPLFPTLYE